MEKVVKELKRDLIRKSGAVKRTIKEYISYVKESEEKKKDKYNKNKDLKQINENNFEIKSEYYYIEEEDSKVPYIFEKTIKKIIKNQPNKQFKEVIEKNELTILSKNKKKVLKKKKLKKRK